MTDERQPGGSHVLSYNEMKARESQQPGGSGAGSTVCEELECCRCIPLLKTAIEDAQAEIARLREALRLVEPVLKQELYSDEWERIEALVAVNVAEKSQCCSEARPHVGAFDIKVGETHWCVNRYSFGE